MIKIVTVNRKKIEDKYSSNILYILQVQTVVYKD